MQHLRIPVLRILQLQTMRDLFVITAIKRTEIRIIEVRTVVIRTIVTRKTEGAITVREASTREIVRRMVRVRTEEV